MNRPRRANRRLILAGIAVLGLTATAAPAAATPAAPASTAAVPTAASPTAPSPHPPRGGIGPNGQPVGGAELLSRGIVVPAGSSRLPAGLTAASWIVTDLDTGAVLAARDAHGRYQPASVLKVLTALVLLPRLAGARIVTASADAANVEGSAVGLVPGGRYSVDTLFRSMMLMSGNDATEALAEAAGGPAPVVAAMNGLAARLGAYDTVVETPSGLDGWKQLSSVYDLSVILRVATSNARLMAYDRALTAALPAQQVGARTWGPVPLYNQSENFLTGVPGAIMAKTGFTDAAAHTYMCAAQRGGRRLGVVFLRAQRQPTDQWQQAASLLNWGFALRPTFAAVGTLNTAVTDPTPSPSVTPSSGAPAAPGSSGAAQPTNTTGPTPVDRASTAVRPSTRSRWAWLEIGAGLVLLVALAVRVIRRRRRGRD